MSMERILVAFAHPDDAEFSVGGTVAAWTSQGIHVTYVCVTDGSAGSNEPGAVREEIAAVREREMRAAAKLLGVSEVVFLGYRDGTLEASLDLRRDLTREVRRVRPDVLVAPDPSRLWTSRRQVGRADYVNHRDHRMVGEVALAVVNDAPTRPQYPELIEEGHEPYELPALWLPVWDPADGDRFVDITETLDRKVEAIRAHESQIADWPIERFVGDLGREMAKGRDMEFAEAFRVLTLMDQDADDGGEEVPIPSP